MTLADELGVASRCFWVDAIQNSELPAWYSWCDCFCVPSRSEGFGFVFIEAAACGTPIVTSDIRPMNEYLTHDESACLVRDYTNPRALADGVRKACEESDYRQRISDGARRVAQSFEKDAIDAAEAAIYREALELPPLSLYRRFEIARWKTATALRPVRKSFEGLGRTLLGHSSSSRTA
jgi:glycosyltransferase involved in cell wall biosynthesis